MSLERKRKAESKPEPHDAERPDLPHFGEEDGAAPLSREIVRLIVLCGERELLVQDVVQVLRGRAYLMLLLILSAPFCTPIPLPGVSTPFGLMICVIGLRLAMRQKPWLPRRFLEMRLPAWFPKVLGAANRLVRGIERIMRTRHTYLVDMPVLQHLSGGVIFACGLLLLLPLPVLFSNFFPAATIVLLAAAAIGRDGFFAMIGYVSFVLTLAYFGLIFAGGAVLAAWLAEQFERWFPK